MSQPLPPSGRIAIPVSHGQLEAVLREPAEAPFAAAVVCHPHPRGGGTMNNNVVYRMAKVLGDAGAAVLRFNFRGVGRSDGSFTGGRGEREDFTAALDYMAAQYPGLPLWAAGMSFGSWVALTVGAEDPRVSTLVGIALPISRYDFGAVERSTKPKFFVHGEFDELCPLKEMRAFYARAAEPKELVVIDTADHLFDGKVSQVAGAIEDLLGDWNS